LFTVLYRSKDTPGARLGLAIAKKNSRFAVDRNRLKRIVRESFRVHRSQLGNLDIVVLNKPGTHKTSNAAVFDSLEKHWQRCQADTPELAGYKTDG
jgi:ribonuclease P protein component